MGKALLLSLKKDIILLIKDKVLLFVLVVSLLLGYSFSHMVTPIAKVYVELTSREPAKGGDEERVLELFLSTYGFKRVGSAAQANTVALIQEEGKGLRVSLTPKDLIGYTTLPRLKLALLGFAYSVTKRKPPLKFITKAPKRSPLTRVKGLWVVLALALPLQFLALSVFDERRKGITYMYDLARRKITYISSKLIAGTAVSFLAGLIMCLTVRLPLHTPLTLNLLLLSYLMATIALTSAIYARRMLEASVISRGITMLILLLPLLNLKLLTPFTDPTLLLELKGTTQILIAATLATLLILFPRRLSLREI